MNYLEIFYIISKSNAFNIDITCDTIQLFIINHKCMAMNQYIKDNIIKNIAIIVIAVFLYPVISNSLAQIKLEQTNDFLLIISMLLVTVCFANFAFTYERSKLKTKAGS